MAAGQTPGEFVKGLFEYDVQVLRHLIVQEQDGIDNNSLPHVAHEIALSIANGDMPHSSIETTVLKLYMLDESKKTALQLLEGEK